MGRCEVCNHQMRLQEIVRTALRARRATYPFTHMDGTRGEHPVKRMCDRCAARADRYRTADGRQPPVRSVR